MRRRLPTTRPPNGFYVLLDEEFGCALWFWVPGMPADALEAWWLAVDAASPPLFFDTRNLPGRRILADAATYAALYQAGGLYHAHAHRDDDSFLLRPDGTVILHRGHPRGPGITQR